MRAVVVTPGQAGSERLADVPEPQPDAGQVSIDILDVGVCGTDVEITKGLYGEAPPEDDYLILGHENFGVVADAGGVPGWAPGDHVVSTVRRPDPVPCKPCGAGEYDMCVNGRYTERGIKGRHGFMAERVVEWPQYLVKVPAEVESIGVLMEPLSVVEKGVAEAEIMQQRLSWDPQVAVVTGAGPIGLMATLLLRAKGMSVWTVDLVARDSLRAELVEACGATYVKGDEEPLPTLESRIDPVDLVVEATGVPELVFQAIDVVGPNGVVCLTGVSASSRTQEVQGASLNLDMVLRNKLVFGTVNSRHRYFESAASHLAQFEQLWPGLCERVITRRVPPEDFAAALHARPGQEVKSTISFR